MPKENIHPKYFDNATFICATCGNKLIVGTTLSQDVRIDTCSKCHPFYTGKQNFSNTEGRVEKFKERFAQKEKLEAKHFETKSENKKHNKKEKIVRDLSDLKELSKVTSSNDGETKEIKVAAKKEEKTSEVKVNNKETEAKK
ncbi:50S ribosomal protein L31 [Spiroplasma endosymbiont of Crioceris asparagi]|uniref:50S ribosomal protein L31 n=1 Tax=Spiroplasma endosymbiont of Crioceris asparagi TaxID=3066286 RepID=UPI0030CD8DB4